ncbi:hypothetical protein H4I96_04867 [Botrytis cinerea]
MSSRKHSEDRPPLRGPASSHRGDMHRPDKNYGTRDRQVSEDGHEKRRSDGDHEKKTAAPGEMWKGQIEGAALLRRPARQIFNFLKTSVNPLINLSKQVPVTESYQLESLIDALMQFADQGDSRSLLNQVRNSAEESLKRQVEEIQKMGPIMQSFPTHMDVQNKRKVEAEEVLKKTNEELEKAKRLQKEAAKTIASRLVIKASPPIADDSKYLQERCRKLEEKVKDLEKTMTAMDQKHKFSDINDRFQESQAEYRKVVTEIKRSEARFAEKIEASESKIKREHQNLSDQFTNLDQRHQATRSEEASKQSTILKAKSDDIDLLTRKVTSLENLSKTHKVSLDDFKSSSLEKISQLKDETTKFFELQTAQRAVPEEFGAYEQELNAMKDAHKTILKSLGTSVEELNSLKDKTRIRNAQEDIRVLDERIDKIESSLGSPNRATPQEDAKVNEKLKSTLENYESRLSELEDSLKKVDSVSMNKPVTKMSPFSTAGQDVTDVKKAFEFYKEQREKMDQILSRRIEEHDNQVKSMQRNDITTNEQIVQIQIRMDVFVEDLNRIAHRVTDTANDQNANTIALRHLHSRFNNISTDDLAKNMLRQLEVIYPDVGNAERTFLELRKLHSNHITQLERLKSQVVALQSHPVSKQSPANAGNGATESLRQEVDSLTKGQIKLGSTAKKLDEATTSTQARLNTLEQSHTALDLKIQNVNEKIETQQKSLTEMSADLIEAVGDLQAGLEYLQNSIGTELEGDTPAPAQPTLLRAHQSSAQEAVANGKKRKNPTSEELSKPESLNNGRKRGPLRKRTKRAEDGEDLE